MIAQHALPDIMKSIIGCPLVISVVISYDAIAYKIECAGINILLMIWAFISSYYRTNTKDGGQSELAIAAHYNVNKSVIGALAGTHLYLRFVKHIID